MRLVTFSSLALVSAALFTAPRASAEAWTLWADGSQGIKSATYPRLAINSSTRDIYYSYLIPQPDGNGVVYRAKLDDPAHVFKAMPTFKLPTPAAGKPYVNVVSMTTTAKGEPVVGLGANGSSSNMDPMLMTWDEQAQKWITPPISPPNKICSHNLYTIERAPNGDIWAGCQWSGVYHSKDDGRTFQFVDVNALVASSTPGYFPTVAAKTDNVGAMYGLAIGQDGTVYFGTETGGIIYSSDDGVSFHPLDADPTNPMSTMARAQNMGNAAGIGVMLDGRAIVGGVPGQGAYPPADAVHLYLFDRQAKTTTVATGIPDYVLGGQGISKIVTLSTGLVLLHSNIDTVNAMTGAAQFGGIRSSTDGVNWVDQNEGIKETFFVNQIQQWTDANGKGAGGSLAADGANAYTATTNGKIFLLATQGSSGSSTSSGSGSSGSATSSSGGGNGGAGGTSNVGGSGGSDGGSGGQTSTENAAGCGCSVPARQSIPWWAGLAVVGALGFRIRRARKTQ